jgi:hypothetical protein
MTAVRNQTTLDALARAAEIIAFINQHGDKLGPLCTISANEPIFTTSVSGMAQIAADGATESAAALIAWFYLLDAPRVTSTKHKDRTQVTVRGLLAGNEFWAYDSFVGDAAVYLKIQPEMSVHALRRIQVGDVPAVDTEPVPA